MPGLLQWLDYSEHDRRKALDVIALFHEQDTRDELGLGAVRDGFAHRTSLVEMDALFASLQHRAFRGEL